MNILLVSKYDMAKGGVASVLHALQQYLKSRGHQAYVLTHDPNASSDSLKSQVKDNNPIFYLDFGIAKFIPSLLYKHRLRYFLQSLEIDIIHGHGLSRSELALKLARMHEIPFVVTSHGDLHHPKTFSFQRKQKIKHILRHADFVTHLTKPMADLADSIYDTKHKSQIIPNGIALSTLGPPDPIRENYWLGLGRFVKQKGFAHLIHTYGESVRRGIKDSLILLGDGPERDALISTCFDLKMRIKYTLPRIRFEPNTVYFLGHIDGQAKRLLMKRAKFFAFPSQTDEAFSLVLLEAMASGLPIIASDCSMTRYLRSCGMRAKLAPHTNPILWADMIDALYSEDMDALGQQNYDAAQIFNIQKILLAYENVYLSLKEKII